MDKHSLLFRLATSDDVPALYRLAEQSGVGLTTLPADHAWLAREVERSLSSIQTEVLSPQQEKYLFVLDDVAQQQVVGVSAIEACVGWDLPFYSYKLVTESVLCSELKQKQDRQVLYLVNDFHGATEICTLMLAPAYRRLRVGSLLSRGRFLWMAEHPQRVSCRVFAEMRGMSDGTGAPFWEALLRPFFQMDFAQASTRSILTDKQFIADLMPVHPIYVDLLPAEVQAVIQQPHPETEPALKLLQRDGFDMAAYVDIFDAGPVVVARLQDISTVRDSTQHPIVQVVDQLPQQATALISCHDSYFRAAMAPVAVGADQSVVLTSHTAKLLQVDVGQTIRVMQ